MLLTLIESKEKGWKMQMLRKISQVFMEKIGNKDTTLGH